MVTTNGNQTYMVSLVRVFWLASIDLLPPMLELVYRLQFIKWRVRDIPTVDDSSPIVEWIDAVVHARGEIAL
jgi:hypothetical protein